MALFFHEKFIFFGRTNDEERAAPPPKNEGRNQPHPKRGREKHGLR